MTDSRQMMKRARTVCTASQIFIFARRAVCPGICLKWMEFPHAGLSSYINIFFITLVSAKRSASFREQMKKAKCGNCLLDCHQTSYQHHLSTSNFMWVKHLIFSECIYSFKGSVTLETSTWGTCVTWRGGLCHLSG